MKKILSILIALVLVGGAVFAQDAPEMPAPVFKGEAKLSWGIDLGSGISGSDAAISHGFLNEASASVSLPFVKSGSKQGEGDVYAFIDLSDVKLGLEADLKGAKANGKVGKVSAKIVFFGAYITVYNAPSMNTSYAHRNFLGNGNKFITGFGGYGTKLGYANKDMMDIDVGIKFVSNGSWEDRDGYFSEKFIKEVKVNSDEWYNVPSGHELYYTDYDGTRKKLGAGWKFLRAGVTYYEWQTASVESHSNGRYAFGLDFHMMPVENYLTIDANFNMTIDRRNVYQRGARSNFDKPIIGVGLNLKSTPIEGLNINLGFDGGHGYKSTSHPASPVPLFAWALGLGVDYKHEAAGTFETALYVSSDGTPYGKKAVVVLPGVKGGIDMAFSFGYKGLPFVKGLDIHTKVIVEQLLSKISKEQKGNNVTFPIGFNFGLGYKYDITDSMSIKPYADLWGNTNMNMYKNGTVTAKNYFGLAYKAGLEFMPMERLTIDASWQHGSLPERRSAFDSDSAYDGGQEHAPFQYNSHNGKFILSATITY